MGSATREALVSSRGALAALEGGADRETGEQLLAAARVIGDSAPLRSTLVDPSADPVLKQAVVGKVFAPYGTKARALLDALVASRWSSQDDLLAGVEELGIRALAESAPAGTDVVAELLAFGRAVMSDSGLELAIGSKLGGREAKLSLVNRLLEGKASAETVSIVGHLVQQPRGRRIGELLRYAARIVADQGGLAVATVTSAKPLSEPQLERLATGLAAQYGRRLHLHELIDPAIIGGLRIQVGDDVIDGSVASRLNDLRLQLAG